jgi:uncharacterized membrane protein (DUF2068 family)
MSCLHQMPRPQSDLLIRLIALGKLAKAAMLVALGLGALSMRHDHSWLGDWIHAIAADPHGRLVAKALARVSSLTVHQLVSIGIGSLVYAAIFVTEGVGLWLRRAWAEVMTVLVTISFVPLEIYELAEHPSWAKVAMIAVNALIVGYLLRRLRREQHWPFHRAARRPGTSSDGKVDDRIAERIG